MELPADYSSERKEVIIPANSTATTRLAINITHKEDSGETEIGKIIIKGANGAELDEIKLIQNTKSMLSLRKLKEVSLMSFSSYILRASNNRTF